MKFFSKKYLILFIFISLFLLTGLVGVYVIKSNPRYYNKIKSYAKSVIKTKDKTSYYNSKLIRDDYSLHRKAAKSNGNKVISENNITQLINSGKLVKVNPNNGYKINKLTHSKHVLTPESYHSIMESAICQRFEFKDLDDFNETMDRFRKFYNFDRIHGSLEFTSPAKFLKKTWF